MIESKYVDLYARNSGIKDKLVAERDVVLTYALRALIDSGAMAQLAFKGGTCLRKITFGSSGRFSEDLDFTADTDANPDEVLIRVVDTFNAEHFGITFTMDDYYKTDDDGSFGGDVLYRHSWNTTGRFSLQISLRERPTLPVAMRALKPQGYFSFMEIEPFAVRSLNDHEMIAEKIRAACQRAKVRDLYDLHRFATQPFDNELLRSLVVLKLWQVRDGFDAEAFFNKLRHGQYDWDDLRRLMRINEQPAPEKIINAVESRYAFLRETTLAERELIADSARGRAVSAAERLRAGVRSRFSRIV
jgi:predicted nucleotidyltransferase component of viral defense system